ncbi:hypothetical protein CANARDRAFT_29754, partial [[Candida] arabinofermentans NRRL YB-2248]
MHELSPGDWNNFKIDSPILYGWNSLLQLRNERIKINEDPIDELEVDIPRSLAATLQSITDINPMNTAREKKMAKEKFTIILMSNLKQKSDWEGLFEPICQVASKYDVLICVNYFPVDHDSSSEKEVGVFKENMTNLAKLVDMLSKSGGRVAESLLQPFEDAKTYINDWNKEPVNFVKPVKVFKGEIRIGCDVNSLDLENSFSEANYFGSEKDALTNGYNKNTDPLSLCIKVDGFPLIKVDRPTLFNEVNVQYDSNTKTHKISTIKSTRETFVMVKPDQDTDDDDEDAEDADTGERSSKETAILKNIGYNEIQQVYNYGKSMIPVTGPLKEQIKIPTYTGIDVIKITKKSDIPPWYYRDESIVILPQQTSTIADQVEFNMLAQSMIRLGVVAIVRYVQKDNAAEKLAALIPNIVMTAETKSRPQTAEFKPKQEDFKRKFDEMSEDSLEGNFYGFSLVKLSFVDDEKIPSMFKLSGIYDPEKATNTPKDEFFKENYPNKEMIDLMNELIDNLDFDKPSDQINEDMYLELNDLDTVPIARTKGIEVQSTGKTFSDNTRALLSQNEQQIHWTQLFIKKLVYYHLQEAQTGDSLYDLMQKSKDESFSDASSFLQDFTEEAINFMVHTNEKYGKSLFTEHEKKKLENGALEDLLQKMELLLDNKKS